MILNGDCLDLMKNIESGSIDMILADLPYGTTACKWDTIIPFEPLWNEYKRIIKPNGAITLTSTQPFTTKVISSNYEWFRYEIIWEKPNITNFWYVKKQIAKKHENISIFYNKSPTFNPIKINSEFRSGSPKQIKDRLVFDHHQGSNTIKNDNWIETGKRYQGSVIKCSHDFEKSSTKTQQNRHPTQKPVELFEFLIKTYTNEGELVLDNTAGSGTTAIACLNTNRQFIVMEKEQKYYDIILKRVGDFNKNFEPQTLFGNET